MLNQIFDQAVGLNARALGTGKTSSIAIQSVVLPNLFQVIHPRPQWQLQPPQPVLRHLHPITQVEVAEVVGQRALLYSSSWLWDSGLCSQIYGMSDRSEWNFFMLYSWMTVD